MRSMKLYDSKAWVHKRYVLEKKTIREMAMEANCSHMTIQRVLQQHGFIKKPRKWTK